MSWACSAELFALASVTLDGRYCRGQCSGFEVMYVHQVGLAYDGFPLRHGTVAAVATAALCAVMDHTVQSWL